MSLRLDIQSAQKQAMKQGEAEKLSTLRLAWAAMRNEEINVQHELSDDEVQKILLRQVKQLEDAISDYQKGGRQDLIDKTNGEIAILRGFLPTQLSIDELKPIVERIVKESGASTSKDVGRVMGLVMKEVGNRANGNQVRELVQKMLSN